MSLHSAFPIWNEISYIFFFEKTLALSHPTDSDRNLYDNSIKLENVLFPAESPICPVRVFPKSPNDNIRELRMIKKTTLSLKWTVIKQTTQRWKEEKRRKKRKESLSRVLFWIPARPANSNRKLGIRQREPRALFPAHFVHCWLSKWSPGPLWHLVFLNVIPDVFTDDLLLVFAAVDAAVALFHFFSACLVERNDLKSNKHIKRFSEEGIERVVFSEKYPLANGCHGRFPDASGFRSISLRQPLLLGQMLWETLSDLRDLCFSGDFGAGVRLRRSQRI